VDYFLPRASYNPRAETQTGSIYTNQHSNDRMILLRNKTCITNIKTLIFCIVAGFLRYDTISWPINRYMDLIRDKWLSSSQTMETGKLVCLWACHGSLLYTSRSNAGMLFP
jgi:hypothetical protein